MRLDADRPESVRRTPAGSISLGRDASYRGCQGTTARRWRILLQCIGFESDVAEGGNSSRWSSSRRTDWPGEPADSALPPSPMVDPVRLDAAGAASIDVSYAYRAGDRARTGDVQLGKLA